MLKESLLYKDQIQEQYNKIKYDDKYKFLFANSYRNEKFDLRIGLEDCIEMVSVNKENIVIGYLLAKVERDWLIITDLRILNFREKGNITFSRDLYEFLQNLFVKEGFRKLQFKCIVGNPIMKMYERYIERYNGKNIGTFHNSVRLSDGKIYDYTLYELFKEDYDRIIKEKRDKKLDNVIKLEQ